MDFRRRGRFVLAVAASAALVLAGPYIGIVRAKLRAAVPGRFGLIVNILIALLLAGAALAALARIRERRWLRYAVLVLAAVLGVLFSRYNATGLPDSIVVERFHFVEYGIITFLFYRAWRPRGDSSALVLAATAAFLVGIADEGLQWFVPGRYGELRDVALNSAAILCGALFSYAVDPVPLSRRWVPGSFRRVGLAGGAMLLALAGFVDVVHLGTLIEDPAIGAFRSRHSPAELAALSGRRAVDWQRAPPAVPPPLWSREDQYLTEAVWHVQKRNELWTEGNLAGAWRENQILENYFSPALDLGHRWPPSQRADAEARAAGHPGAYVSHADRYPIYVWNREVFRILAGVLTAALVVICFVADRGERVASSVLPYA